MSLANVSLKIDPPSLAKVALQNGSNASKHNRKNPVSSTKVALQNGTSI